MMSEAQLCPSSTTRSLMVRPPTKVAGAAPPDCRGMPGSHVRFAPESGLRICGSRPNFYRLPWCASDLLNCPASPGHAQGSTNFFGNNPHLAPACDLVFLTQNNLAVDRQQFLGKPPEWPSTVRFPWHCGVVPCKLLYCPRFMLIMSINQYQQFSSPHPIGRSRDERAPQALTMARGYCVCAPLAQRRCNDKGSKTAPSPGFQPAS